MCSWEGTNKYLGRNLRDKSHSAVSQESVCSYLFLWGGGSEVLFYMRPAIQLRDKVTFQLVSIWSTSKPCDCPSMQRYDLTPGIARFPNAPGPPVCKEGP